MNGFLFSPSSARAAEIAQRGLMLTFLSSAAWVGSNLTTLQAQPAPESVTLDTLSVEGVGIGRNAAGSQPGGAVGPVRGYVATESRVATKTDTPIVETAQSNFLSF